MAPRKSIVGTRFLLTHPGMETLLELNNDYAIVKRSELIEIFKFFEKNPAVQGLFDGSAKMETEDPKDRVIYFAKRVPTDEDYYFIEKEPSGTPDFVVYGYLTDEALTFRPGLVAGRVVCTVDGKHLFITNIESYEAFRQRKDSYQGPAGACEGPREVELPIKPRKEWLEERRHILHAVISLRIGVSEPVPEDWIKNYNECVLRLKDYE